MRARSAVDRHVERVQLSHPPLQAAAAELQLRGAAISQVDLGLCLEAPELIGTELDLVRAQGAAHLRLGARSAERSSRSERSACIRQELGEGRNVQIPRQGRVGAVVAMCLQVSGAKTQVGVIDLE